MSKNPTNPRFNQNTHNVLNYTPDRMNVPDFIGQLDGFINGAVVELQQALGAVDYPGGLNMYIGKVGIAMTVARALGRSHHEAHYPDLNLLNSDSRHQSKGIGFTSDTLAVELYNSLRTKTPFSTDKLDYHGQHSDEILNGRAGLALLLDYFAQKGVKFTEPAIISHVLNQINLESFPWSWNDKVYYGAAHGTAGILLTLKRLGNHAHVDLFHRLIADAKLESGNFKSSEGSTKDELVQWCHGATGFVPLLYAYENSLRSTEERNTNSQNIHNALEVLWQRGILSKGCSVCHGVAGNGYPFLTAYIHTLNPHELAKAIAFAHEILYFGPLHACGTADRPFSLFEGLAGVVHYLIDLAELLQLTINHEDEKIRNFVLFDGLRIF